MSDVQLCLNAGSQFAVDVGAGVPDLAATDVASKDTVRAFAQSSAAGAAWLRSCEGRLVRSGLCPSYVSDANAAEPAAIFAGAVKHPRIAISGVCLDAVQTMVQSARDLSVCG